MLPSQPLRARILFSHRLHHVLLSHHRRPVVHQGAWEQPAGSHCVQGPVWQEESQPRGTGVSRKSGRVRMSAKLPWAVRGTGSGRRTCCWLTTLAHLMLSHTGSGSRK